MSPGGGVGGQSRRIGVAPSLVNGRSPEAEKEEKTDTYYSCERSYGEFTRSFTLPEGVQMNTLQANLTDGVLTLSVRKTPEAQPKKIAVQTKKA